MNASDWAGVRPIVHERAMARVCPTSLHRTWQCESTTVDCQVRSRPVTGAVFLIGQESGDILVIMGILLPVDPKIITPTMVS